MEVKRNDPEHYRLWGSAVTVCGATEHQQVYLGTSDLDDVTCPKCLKLARRVCTFCDDEILWHSGNGGQWIGAHPPRDWVTCHGSVNGRKHAPEEERPATDEEVAEALASIGEAASHTRDAS